MPTENQHFINFSAEVGGNASYYYNKFTKAEEKLETVDAETAELRAERDSLLRTTRILERQVDTLTIRVDKRNWRPKGEQDPKSQNLL